jgi:hypothetical protein
MAKIQIDLDEQGFEHLWNNSMAWDGNVWAIQEDRFDPKPEFSWKFAYWFDSYVSLKMGEAYLTAVNEDYSIHSDEAGDWLLLTNFASPCHKR